MTNDEAVELLTIGSSHERLRAARFLARNARSCDIAALQNARRMEAVSYIRISLDLALNRLSSRAPVIVSDPSDEFDVPDDVRRQIRTHAVEWIAGLLLHEIASPIGLVKRSASREIPNYPDSRTKRHLESVERIFKAIEQLKGAAAVPRPEQFDLSECLKDIVTVEADDAELTKISLVGAKPLIITSDPALVILAVRNGLRNALESITAADVTATYPIIITWGQTDVDYWVAIVDQGAGIVGSPESAFDIGKSTKQGHSGFGLAIARQAIETLGGSVSLEPAAQGGTRYEARWER